MSKKDYQLIVDVLAEAFNESVGKDYSASYIIGVLVGEFSNRLAVEPSIFCKARFLKAFYKATGIYNA